MDLASIVASAFAALPPGLSGVGVFTRSSVDSSTVTLLTDAPGAPSVATATADVVLDVPSPDRVLPPGMVRERSRLATMPSAPLGAFVPQSGDTLTVAGVAWTVVEGVPVDPTGAAPALYTLLVRN